MCRCCTRFCVGGAPQALVSLYHPKGTGSTNANIFEDRMADLTWTITFFEKIQFYDSFLSARR